MRFRLATLVRRARPGIRRRAITLRPIEPPAVMATDLYRAAFLPVIEAWQRGAERLSAEYARSLAALVTDGATVTKSETVRDSALDLESILGDLGAELQRILLEITPRLRDWSVRVEGWHRGKFRGSVLSATGVELSTLIGPEDVRETLQAFIGRNVELVRSVSDQARGRIADTVFRGLTNRTPAREVAREISEATGMARRRALNIAADQLSKASATLDEERQREAGLDVWRWRHSGKRHPRPHHKARDGNLYSESSARVGTQVEGVTVLAPPAREDQPGIPPWCGCRRQAVLVLD